MTKEILTEPDHSLDGTLADLIISGDMKRFGSIFPRRVDRLQAYGKIIAPILRHPLRALVLGFEDSEGRQITNKFNKELAEWAIEKCAPEYKGPIETALGEMPGAA